MLSLNQNASQQVWTSYKAQKGEGQRFGSPSFRVFMSQNTTSHRSIIILSALCSPHVQNRIITVWYPRWFYSSLNNPFKNRGSVWRRCQNYRLYQYSHYEYTFSFNRTSSLFVLLVAVIAAVHVTSCCFLPQPPVDLVASIKQVLTILQHFIPMPGDGKVMMSLYHLHLIPRILLGNGE